MRKTNSKTKSVAIQNPRLVMRDAMGFKFRVMGTNDQLTHFNVAVSDLLYLRKFAGVVFSGVVDKKDSDVYTLLSANSTLMIELMDRIPTIAAKNGCTIRNIK